VEHQTVIKTGSDEAAFGDIGRGNKHLDCLLPLSKVSRYHEGWFYGLIFVLQLYRQAGQHYSHLVLPTARSDFCRC
jgi:hypothetical protein